MRYILFVVLLFGCGKLDERTIRVVSNEPSACTVIQTQSGATVSCPDGTTAVINNGANGLNGEVGPSGSQGVAGSSGKDGVDGKDGHSCYTEAIPEGARIKCSNGSEAIVLNGVGGKDGAAGKDGRVVRCSISYVDLGVVIYCTDGTYVVISTHSKKGDK